MDSAYELAGAQASGAFQQVLWSLGIPLIVALGGVAWRIHRVAEDGVVRPLGFYLLSLFLIVWLLRPVGDGSARFVAWLGEGSDLAVRRTILAVNRDFLSRPFEYERRAAISEAAHVRDPRLRTDLHLFFATCTANAMARGGMVEPGNPLAPGTVLKYDGLRFGETDEPCGQARGRLWNALQNDAAGAYGWTGALGVAPEDLLETIVANEWHGRIADWPEMAMVRGSVGEYMRAADVEGGSVAFPRQPATAGAAVRRVGTDAMYTPLRLAAHLGEQVLSLWAQAGQHTSDLVTSRQRYYAVTAYAPVVYGLVLMLLTAFFPIAGLWALFPGKWTALVSFGKAFLSVKLWPLGWAIVTMFAQRRPAADFDATPPASVFVAITLLYFAVPAISFLVVNLAARAAAAPFAQAPLAGPSNGPAGQVAVMAAGRVR